MAPEFTVTADAAVARLDGIEAFPELALRVALPVRYTSWGGRRYPLLLVLDGAGFLGSAIEMSRLMAQTRELRACIVVGVDCAADAATATRVREVLKWCAGRYRVASEEMVVFGAGEAGLHALAVLRGATGVTGAIVSALPPEAQDAGAAGGQRLLVYGPGAAASHAAPGWPVPDLVSGLRALWSTGKEPGKGYAVLGLPAVRPLLLALSLPLRAVKKLRGAAAAADNAHRVCSAAMGRDFELFVSLPRSYAQDPTRAYPLVLVLDANLEFSTAAEAAAAMAAAGAIGEALVVGIGAPRAEGMAEFAFRRFEELSPPAAEDYRYDDGMGRIMRGLFALRGQEARLRLGQAPLFYRFLCDEVLPMLRGRYRIEPQRIALLGHSAGGAFTCYALLQQDAPFTDYAGISPGIGMSGFWLRQQAAAGAKTAPRARRVVLSIGGEEEAEGTEAGSGIPQTRDFAERLRENGAAGVHYRCYDGESHTSVYARAVAQALRDILPL